MKNPALALLAFLALVAAPAADAQDGSAYYGIAFGDFEYDEGDFGISDKASSWRLMINYQFMEYLAVEGGYGQTGTLRETFAVPTFPTGTTDLNLSADFQILTVRLLGVLPLDNFKLLGGLGYSDMKGDFELTFGVDSASVDIDSNEPGYYVGVQYDWDRVAVRLGYEKFDFDGDVDVAETMLSFFYKL
jgi:opacity protein-like surface antigen